MSGPFQQHGGTLVANGYQIVPIPMGTKGPRYPEWRALRLTSAAQFDAFCAGTHQVEIKGELVTQPNVPRQAGVGIQCAHTPGFDCDSSSPEMVAHMREFLFDNLGPAPVRVGRAPKFLAMYATSRPFRKLHTGDWYDPAGNKHAFEVLAEGQQFVAYHTHPDTGRPYVWIDEGQNPLDISTIDLTEITVEHAQAVVREFCRKAAEMGWELKGKTRNEAAVSSASPGPEDVADALGQGVPPDESEAEVARARAALLAISPDCSRAEYLVVLAGLKWTGWLCAEEMALAWAQGSQEDKFNERDFNRDWRSLKQEHGARTVTLASLYATAKEAGWDASRAREVGDADLRTRFLEQVKTATTSKDIEAVAHKISKEKGLFDVDRVLLAQAVQQALKAATNFQIPIAVARGLVAYRSVDAKATPPWAAKWVYRQDTDEFFNLKSKVSISTKAFDFEYDRMITAEMREQASMFHASEFCREVWSTPVVAGVIYLPAADELFTHAGQEWANAYRADQVPLTLAASEWGAEEKAAVARVQDHLQRIVPNVEDRTSLLQWMAWVVTHPGDKVNWAPLIIGNYGDGKSLLVNLLSEVMGFANVKMLSGNVISNSDFTGWAEGTCVTAIEEIRLSGHNRFEMMDKMKPLITNDRVDVHAKGRDPVTVANTVSYMALSNYLDAMPIDAHDRRWFAIVTPFVGLSREEIEAGGMDSEYFKRLVAAIRDHASALRGWMFAVDLKKFNPKYNAPRSSSKARIVDLCRSDDEVFIHDLLAQGGVGISERCFSTISLAEELQRLGRKLPSTTAMNRMMQAMGFVKYPKQIKWRGYPHRVWLKPPLHFIDDTVRIRTLLDECSTWTATDEFGGL